ncbi:unnamed protein product, partial [Ectocarpus sp. 13 AM-2016]
DAGILVRDLARRPFRGAQEGALGFRRHSRHPTDHLGPWAYRWARAVGQGQRGQRLRVLRPPIDHLRLRPYRRRAPCSVALRTGVADSSRHAAAVGRR